jgi:uncharacterized protein YeaO (DUF488 family)
MKKAGKSKKAAAPRGSARTSIAVKRAYEDPSADDGLRILVDRLWPRGLTKTKLKVDIWPKHLAPSTELRRWYHGGGGSFAEFRRRYLTEIRKQGESLDELRAAVRGHKVTLITGSREPEVSHATVLCDALARRRS